MEKRKLGLLFVGLLLVVCVFIGVSYAVWSINLKQEGVNTISTGCFHVTFSGKNDIHLEGAYPILNEDGKSLTPYEFTIINTCDSAATYQINLEVLNDSTFTELGYIRELLQEKGSSGVSHLLTTQPVVVKTLDDASSSYLLNTGLLYGGSSKTFELRLWMDEDTPAIDSVMNKTLNSKIAVVTSYSDIDTTNMMIPMNIQIGDSGESGISNLTYTQNNKYKLSSLSFEKELNPYLNAVEVVDFSVNQDQSVLGYYILNENDRYDLHIQANGKIKANPNASYYFSYVEYNFQLNGLENIDTSEVVDMSGMFWYSIFLRELDLSHFDTSKVTNMSDMFLHCLFLTDLNLNGWDTGRVTNMSGMFSRCNSLTTLNITHFNTEHVIDMSGMFSDCNSLIHLDLSGFDTSNVTDMKFMFANTFFYEAESKLSSLDLSSFDTSNVTNMSYMFCNLNGLTSLDVSHFITSKVTDMSSMFDGMTSLTSLDLTSFDTRNVTDMSSMFDGMTSLTSLDLSSFDTSNVTDMGSMFRYSSNLTNIVYGTHFVYKNNAKISSMFSNCPANKPTDASWNGVFS